ncbi:hypothetical protein MPTK1_6g20050 [Marchantia polymorpha subsp. ruderalis]|uniref:Uncharacterized protein n=2 Tax=Marchantia polymorpha TaxID=3197 RepID=A0AAF6BU13_MARPO|nr:hypothetical protein MARPO_0045s0058 [Marchantia polymorpha]BBN15497.1 hypothetical protein Mp_6g20050 [Marchantia polymorpha subsp. ruderalis]|eukprot:PTQ39394.1 hypothetical protein MARPO_0045s0058 [Marchantia polymorpha]
MRHHEDSKPNTFHEAIKNFMRPPNPNAKPAIPAFRRRSRRRESVQKPGFEFNDETFHEGRSTNTPRRFDGSAAGVITFKSPAVFCEVKLAEMLSKSPAPRGKPVTPGKYEFAPDGYRTSVCCQLLAEIGKMSTPFANVLATIHEELEQAIYSNYVTPSHTSVFEQVPYFELVSCVESKNAAMLDEQERWKVMLRDREADISRIEANMQELREQIIAERETVLELQKKLNQTAIALERRIKEVAKLSSQIEESRAEVLHARNIEHCLEHEKSEYENLMAKHLLLITELQHCQMNLEVARKEAAEGVPKKEMAVLRAQVKDLQQKLMKAEILTQQMGSMTPRPHWALLRGGAHYTMSTAAQAAEICKLNDLLLDNVTTLRLECATAQVALAEVIFSASNLSASSHCCNL